MREIQASDVTQTVRRLCVEANCRLPEDMRACIARSRDEEAWPIARDILDRIIENYEIADRDCVPICQDTGMACVFLEIGQDAHVNGDLAEAVHEGVRQGYADGYLRKSVVADPLRRVSTGDNTPAVIASTASPYKFPDSVLDAFDCEKPADPFAEAELLAKLSNTKIPAPITALRTKPVRFENTCAAADMADFVRETVRV